MDKKKNIFSLFDETNLENVWRREFNESELKRLIVRPKNMNIIIVVLLVLISYGVLGYMLYHNKKVYEAELNNINEELIISNNNNDLYCLIGEYALIGKTEIPDDTVVFDFIKETGAWYPEIIMAQYILESNSGKSDIAVNAENLFGMRPVRTRPTLQFPDNDYKGYGVYKHWQYSVLDRVLWEEFVFDSIPTKEQYIKRIESIYAEDKNYVSKIISISKNWIDTVDAKY